MPTYYERNKERLKAKAKENYELNKAARREKQDEWRANNKEAMQQSRKKWLHNNPEYVMLHNAKRRARETGCPFDITVEDIVIPEYCPVFPDVKLERGAGASSDASPSLDKIRPELGYVKGNVMVMSSGANRLKSNASLEKLESLVKFLKTLT